MFTWICPKCGGEVPPSYSDCPKCAPQAAAPPSQPQAQAPPAPAVPWQPQAQAPYDPGAPWPPQTQAPQAPGAPWQPQAQAPQAGAPWQPQAQTPQAGAPWQPQAQAPQPTGAHWQPQEETPQTTLYPPPQYSAPVTPEPAVPAASTSAFHPLLTPQALSTRTPMPVNEAPPRHHLSPTLVAIGAAAGLVAILGVLYLYVLPGRSQATDTKATALQNPAPAASTPSAHPLAKHLEVAGVRIAETSPQTAKVSFVVINHSAADLPELKMQVILRPTTGGNPIFDFPVNLPSIGPFESRDMTSTLKTTLKPYELPDWQMLRPEFRITSEP